MIIDIARKGIKMKIKSIKEPNKILEFKVELFKEGEDVTTNCSLDTFDKGLNIPSCAVFLNELYRAIDEVLDGAPDDVKELLAKESVMKLNNKTVH